MDLVRGVDIAGSWGRLVGVVCPHAPRHAIRALVEPVEPYRVTIIVYPLRGGSGAAGYESSVLEALQPPEIRPLHRAVTVDLLWANGQLTMLGYDNGQTGQGIPVNMWGYIDYAVNAAMGETKKQ